METLKSIWPGPTVSPAEGHTDSPPPGFSSRRHASSPFLLPFATSASYSASSSSSSFFFHPLATLPLLTFPPRSFFPHYSYDLYIPHMCGIPILFRRKEFQNCRLTLTRIVLTSQTMLFLLIFSPFFQPISSPTLSFSSQFVIVSGFLLSR